MTDATTQYQLIITGPGKGDLWEASKSIGGVLKAFADNIPNFYAGQDPDVYAGAMESGLPYHLPYSFARDAANEFKWQLEYEGCEVKLVEVPG